LARQSLEIDAVDAIRYCALGEGHEMRDARAQSRHDHVFLGEGHERGERNVWMVIALTSVMMIAEIVGGTMFGSIALVADGFHMSTHAGALLLAALAYTMARQRTGDERFTFGTGKFGDLAGYSSALILAMISAGIAYESAARLLAPTPISFAEAIPIAAFGLLVNIASAWLLSRGGHDHHHGHGHRLSHGHDHDHLHDESRRLEIAGAAYLLSVFEDGVPARFRLAALDGQRLASALCFVETMRSDGRRQHFAMADRGAFLESAEEIPEPHEFDVAVKLGSSIANCRFEEHAHSGANRSVSRDNNMRAAILHVIADAAVSVLVIAGLVLAKLFGWLWMDPLVGLVGAAVIASWSFALIRDTAKVLLDMNPDRELTGALRHAIERDGDFLDDLHLWRLGPGHLGAILSIETDSERGIEYYRAAAERVARFSHLTIQIARRSSCPDQEKRDVA
jgi:cation diffusion facilitator family transporter